MNIAFEKNESIEIEDSKIDDFISLAMDIYNTVRKIPMPRKIVRDYPSTLDKDSELFLKIERFCDYFGDNLVQINYIPISGDLEFVIKNASHTYLSNMALMAIGRKNFGI